MSEARECEFNLARKPGRERPCGRPATLINSGPKYDIYRCSRGHTFRVLRLDFFDGSVTQRPVPVHEEALAKEVVLAALAAKRHDLLGRLRTAMEERYRDTGEPVTADDAREILESWDDVPPAEELNRNFMGALFRTQNWVPAPGMHASTTKGSHARRILRWRLS